MPQATTQLTITRLEHYWARHFRDAMWIYQERFPADSRLSVARIRTLLKAGQYQLFVAQEGGKIVGIALIWIGVHPTFVHLDYLAVRQDQQGRGVGTTLYRWLTTHLQEISPHASLLTLEVEEELIPFYRRSATVLLEQVPYLFPGRFGPLPMHLMVYDRQRRQTLSRALVQRIIRALYCGLHQRPVRDPLLLSFLSRVPRPVQLV